MPGTMMPMKVKVRKCLLMAVPVVAALCACLSGCHHIDNHRLPVSYVNVSFVHVGVWENYGITGAGLYRKFNLGERIPAGFPYTALSSTGLGGVLLCSNYYGTPVAYDMACPVECRASVRVFVNEENEAECPQCHSRYDIFEKFGYPIAGKAAEEGWGLEVYNVGFNINGQYALIYYQR